MGSSCTNTYTNQGMCHLPVENDLHESFNGAKVTAACAASLALSWLLQNRVGLQYMIFF